LLAYSLISRFSSKPHVMQGASAVRLSWYCAPCFETAAELLLLTWLQVRNMQREVSRDADIVVAAMISIVGSTLIFQGWRLDPLLLLCQVRTLNNTLCLKTNKMLTKASCNELQGTNIYVLCPTRAALYL
jgi:hypothetical protein